MLVARSFPGQCIHGTCNHTHTRTHSCGDGWCVSLSVTMFMCVLCLNVNTCCSAGLSAAGFDVEFNGKRQKKCGGMELLILL